MITWGTGVAHSDAEKAARDLQQATGADGVVVIILKKDAPAEGVLWLREGAPPHITTNQVVRDIDNVSEELAVEFDARFAAATQDKKGSTP